MYFHFSQMNIGALKTFFFIVREMPDEAEISRDKNLALISCCMSAIQKQDDELRSPYAGEQGSEVSCFCYVVMEV